MLVDMRWSVYFFKPIFEKWKLHKNSLVSTLKYFWCEHLTTKPLVEGVCGGVLALSDTS
jgi:hypothetical protein